MKIFFMRHTPAGKRTLRYAEAKVFAAALEDYILGEYFDRENFKSGIDIFDRLTVGQKVSALSIIGNGLLRKNVPCVNLTAILESAIAAVFEHMKLRIGWEIMEPDPGRKSWRKMVYAARKEAKERMFHHSIVKIWRNGILK